MSAIPYNIARGAASSLQMAPPFSFSDVTMSVFPLRASLSRLNTFCDSYLNQAPHLVQFKPFIPFVYLIILDYGRMSLQAANMGWVSQREVAFGIPLRWLHSTPGGAEFHDWAFTSPFIFVDNEMSMSTGREVYGWPKLLAKLDPSVSEWVRDPHGARRVFQVSTKRAAKSYAGEIQEDRPFLSVYQNRAAGLFDIPPSMDTITKPLQQFSSTVAGFTRLGGDLLRTFTGMASDGISGSPILPNFMDQDVLRENLQPYKRSEWLDPKSWGPGMRDMLWSLFPRTYANTINFKQFRDAADPNATCYQAITSARMPLKSVTRGGFLGPQNMMLGQLDGGFRIDVHNLPGLPIVDSLGLEVAEEREADGTLVSSLAPVCPLWMQVDMTYGLADTLVWRGRRSDWQAGQYVQDLESKRLAKLAEEYAHDDGDFMMVEPIVVGDPTVPEQLTRVARTQKELDEAEDAFDLDYIRTMNFFNTARGGSEAIGGSFTMPNASVRVLPIKAEFAKLNKFVSEYLEVKQHMRFEAWGDYVYLIICDFDQVNSTQNAMSKRRAREVNLAVPVKCYTWFDGDEHVKYPANDPKAMYDKAKSNMVTTGFVSAFSFVDDTGTAITASEVSGIPTMGSRIKSPANDWLNIDLSKDRAKRDILEMSAQVLPALSGQAEAQERPIIQLHSHTPPHTQVHETQHESVNSWITLLAEDLRNKGAQRAHPDSLDLGQGFVLQLLGGDRPINQFSLKQFRDSRYTLNACYQGLIQRSHRVQKLADLRELDEPLHISITDYPTQPIGELLGLKPKFSYPGKDRIVCVYEALRPFSITADLVREAGNTLFERMGERGWRKVDAVDQVFGWRTGGRAEAEAVVAHAKEFKEDVPTEIGYSCLVPRRKKDKPFTMRRRSVFKDNTMMLLRAHVEEGRFESFSVFERDWTGHVEVLTDPKLLKAVSSGDALDIAAFNAQVKRLEGKTSMIRQSKAAGQIAIIDPATVLDSILSRQWGLAPGSKRRYFDKPDFCVPAMTVPNQFTEALFPIPERFNGFWPQSEKYFRNQFSKRVAEELSFAAELVTFLSSIAAFGDQSMSMRGDQGDTLERVDEVILKMDALMSPPERKAFSKIAVPLRDAETVGAGTYEALYQGFANTLLPDTFDLDHDNKDRKRFGKGIVSSPKVSAQAWAEAERALPLLIEIAEFYFDYDVGMTEGLEDLGESFLERVRRNKEEMKRVEAATPEPGSRDPKYAGKPYYLDEPENLLEERLAKLVMGDALNKVNGD